jgi:hypothetical protein
VKRGVVKSEIDKSYWNCGGRRFNNLLSPTSCWELSSVLLNERIPNRFMTYKYNFLLITSEFKFVSIYSLAVNCDDSFSYQNVNISLSHLFIFSGLRLLIQGCLQYTLVLSGITLSLYCLWYRSYATRMSKLKICHFLIIGTERNVSRITFKRYSVITQFVKLAAG